MRIIIAECSLEYAGRGKTIAKPAVRVILIKDDKSVIVHQSNKNIKPINYMKGSKHTVISEAGDSITITNRVESLHVQLINVLSDDSYSITTEDNGLERLGTESDVQEYISLHPWLIRNDAMNVEREVRLGGQPADIVMTSPVSTTIIEVKRESRASSVVWQIIKYAESYKEEHDSYPELVLAALSVTSRVKEECAKHNIRCVELARDTFETWLENKSNKDADDQQ